jgi:hypothetical protein
MKRGKAFGGFISRVTDANDSAAIPLRITDGDYE